MISIDFNANIFPYKHGTSRWHSCTCLAEFFCHDLHRQNNAIKCIMHKTLKLHCMDLQHFHLMPLYSGSFHSSNKLTLKLTSWIIKQLMIYSVHNIKIWPYLTPSDPSKARHILPSKTAHNPEHGRKCDHRCHDKLKAAGYCHHQKSATSSFCGREYVVCLESQS